MKKFNLPCTLALASVFVSVASAATAKPSPGQLFLSPLTDEDTSFGAGCYASDKKNRFYFAEDGAFEPARIRVRGKRITFPIVQDVVDPSGQKGSRIGAWTGRALRKGNTTVLFRVLSEKAAEDMQEIVMTVTHNGKTERRRLRMWCGS